VDDKKLLAHAVVTAQISTTVAVRYVSHDQAKSAYVVSAIQALVLRAHRRGGGSSPSRDRVQSMRVDIPLPMTYSAIFAFEGRVNVRHPGSTARPQGD
jgi:hypothetical protein